MIIKESTNEEIGNILELAWNTFLKYEAPDYTEDGIQEFKKFITNKEAIESLKLYGAYEDNELLGMIATRNENTHIALFFLKDEYQGKGIGRKLYEYIKQLSKEENITVNSSPYALNIYKRLCFIPTSEEQITNGMRYTPMKTLIKK